MHLSSMPTQQWWFTPQTVLPCKWNVNTMLMQWYYSSEKFSVAFHMVLQCEQNCVHTHKHKRTNALYLLKVSSYSNNRTEWQWTWTENWMEKELRWNGNGNWIYMFQTLYICTIYAELELYFEHGCIDYSITGIYSPVGMHKFPHIQKFYIEGNTTGYHLIAIYFVTSPYNWLQGNYNSCKSTELFWIPQNLLLNRN